MKSSGHEIRIIESCQNFSPLGLGSREPLDLKYTLSRCLYSDWTSSLTRLSGRRLDSNCRRFNSRRASFRRRAACGSVYLRACLRRRRRPDIRLFLRRWRWRRRRRRCAHLIGRHLYPVNFCAALTISPTPFPALLPGSSNSIWAQHKLRR